MEDLSVEVYGENGAYYKAIVTDVLDNEVLVAFENDWQPESKFPFSQVFLPPKDTGKHTEFTENQEVEVFARSNEKEACGWWTANIKMMRGDFLVIEYLEWDNCYTEIVPKDRLRVKLPKTPIDKNTFHKFEITVPDELKDYLHDIHSAKVENAHKEFQKAIGAALVWYVPERAVLAVLSRCASSQRRATMLQEMHFRFLAIWWPLKCQITKRRSRMMIVFIWIFAILVTTPWVFFFDLVVVFEENPNVHLCIDVWPNPLSEVLYFVVGNLIFCYILPMVMITMCYILIWIKVWRRSIPTDTQDAQMERMQQKSKVKVVKMLVAVVILFVLSWFPLYLIFARIKLGGPIKKWEFFFGLSYACVRLESTWLIWDLTVCRCWEQSVGPNLSVYSQYPNLFQCSSQR